MEILPSSVLLHSLPIENLVAYLGLIGWKASEASGRWLVFEGSADFSGEPLQIVLPLDSHARDLRVHLANAVSLLSDITEESPEEVVSRIKLCDRDVLRMRNLETGEQDSITLRLAYEQVSELKNLVAYAACSEQNPKPHFNTLSGIGRKIVDRYRFGHTFSGSFGFTVESPIIGEPAVHIQETLMPDMVEKIVTLPFERRVMERIVRGLLATQSATRQRDLKQLTDAYSSGFNSNMCQAIVKMSKEKALPLEYTVLWSPKVDVTDDVKSPDVIRLNETSYEYLEEAARELSKLEPEQVSIRGQIIALKSKDDPLGTGSVPRSVVIRWDVLKGRPRTVVVFLDKDDYVVAHDAHLNWRTVEVSGALEKVGASWQLSEPHNFKVVW